MGSRVCFAALAALTALTAGAALRPNYHIAETQPKSFVSSGVFIGGKELKDASLLDVRLLKSSKSNKERIAIDLGDGSGAALPDRPSYFQVHVQNSPPRIVLDLSNVQKTALGKDQVVLALASSGFVTGTDLTMDPEDHSTNLTFHLRAPQNVSAFLNPKKPGSIYLEIHPLGSAP